MADPNIRDILNSIPDLSYKSKKVKLEDYEAPLEKTAIAEERASEDVASAISNADKVYNRLTELINLAKEAEDVIDDICKDLSYSVNKDDDPLTYNALLRLFGDDFDGTINWKMYSQLIELRFMIADDFAKGALT